MPVCINHPMGVKNFFKCIYLNIQQIKSTRKLHKSGEEIRRRLEQQRAEEEFGEFILNDYVNIQHGIKHSTNSGV